MSKSVFSYGVCYVGSKNKICKWLTDLLPAGERFIDLFGGGGAATHAAVLSGKYKEVVYSDINPFIVKLLQKAVNGDYDYERFTPHWVDRDLFMQSKDDINADPYIKYAFSFGAGGNTYLGTGEALARERAFHNWCVRGEIDDWLAQYFNQADLAFDNPDFDERRYFLRSKFNQILPRNGGGSFSARTLCFLARVQRFGRDCRGRVSISCHGYEDYKYRDGDVVYCDIPYINTSGSKKYVCGFDHEAFYSWARKLPCFISEYTMPSDFKQVACIQKTSSLGTNNNCVSVEVLYKSPYIKLINPRQLLLEDWYEDYRLSQKNQIQAQA